jgi:hypothetical protein
MDGMDREKGRDASNCWIEAHVTDSTHVGTLNRIGSALRLQLRRGWVLVASSRG